jgi:hypothetical protein
LLSNNPPTALSILEIDHTAVAICRSLSFCEYIAALKGLPENLKAIESISRKTRIGRAKFNAISSFVKIDASI